MEHARKIAVKAAQTAGAIIRERAGNIRNIDYKSAFNIVTDVDKHSEQLIIEIIREAFPGDQILGEESGAHRQEGGDRSRRWIIDPLDGTANFAQGYPFFAVSIGVEVDGEMQVGVVYNPTNNELFMAEKGKGAYLNDAQIAVSKHSALGTSLLATGFPPDSRQTKLNNLSEFCQVTDLSMGVRRDGSAALDLCFVACGRLAGFWELKLAPWDLAAGTLMVREAGGKVTNLVGGPFDLESGHVVATNSLIHDELLRTLDFAGTLPQSAEPHVAK